MRQVPHRDSIRYARPWFQLTGVNDEVCYRHRDVSIKDRDTTVSIVVDVTVSLRSKHQSVLTRLKGTVPKYQDTRSCQL